MAHEHATVDQRISKLIAGMIGSHLRSCSKHRMQSVNVKMCPVCGYFLCSVCGCVEMFKEPIQLTCAVDAEAWVCRVIEQGDAFADLHAACLRRPN